MIDNDNSHDKHEDEMMIPFFSIASRDFDQDLTILKKVLDQFEQRTHSENALNRLFPDDNSSKALTDDNSSKECNDVVQSCHVNTGRRSTVPPFTV